MDAEDHREVVQPQQGSNGVLLRVYRLLSSPRVVTALKWVIISGVCGTVVYYMCYTSYYIRTNNEILEKLKEKLQDIIEVLNNKIEGQSTFIKAQQKALLTLLQTVERKFVQDEATRKLVQKDIGKVQLLTEQTMKSIEQMSQVQKPAEKIGTAVMWGVEAAATTLPWPLNLVKNILHIIKLAM